MTVAVDPSGDDQTLAEALDGGLFIDGDWVETKDQDPHGEVRLIQLADVGDGVFRDRSQRFLTQEKAQELRCTFLAPGDVLVARMPEPLGRACIFPDIGQPAVTAVDVCILRPDPETVQSEWLVNAVNAPQFRSSMQEFIRGTTRQRISRKNLGTLRLAVPSLEDQSRTTRLLDNLAHKRAQGSDHVRASQLAMWRFRRAVLSAACSGRLTADWRAAHTDMQAVDDCLDELESRRRGEQGKKYRTPELNRHASDVSLPMSWSLIPLGLLLSDLKYGTSKRSSYESDGVPVLRIPNVNSDRFDTSDLKYATLTEAEITKLALLEQDLLMIRSNGSVELVGKAVSVPDTAVGMAYAGYLMRLRPDIDYVDPKYLELALSTQEVRVQIEMPARSTSGVHNINSQEVRAIGIALPPINEQREIVRRAMTMIKKAKQIESRIRAAERAVTRNGEAVLAKAFRGGLGRVPITHEDRSD